MPATTLSALRRPMIPAAHLDESLFRFSANIEVGIIAGTIAFNLNGNELANTLSARQ